MNLPKAPSNYGKIAPLLELSAGFDKNYTGKNNIFLNGAFLSMDEDFIKENMTKSLNSRNWESTSIILLKITQKV
jgi:ABC-type polysaccharide/polyol phosphate transport system, ATPase component